MINIRAPFNAFRPDVSASNKTTLYDITGYDPTHKPPGCGLQEEWQHQTHRTYEQQGGQTHVSPLSVKSLHQYHGKWRTWWDWIKKPKANRAHGTRPIVKASQKAKEEERIGMNRT